MKTLAIAAVLAAGCASGDDENFPIVPSSPSGGGSIVGGNVLFAGRVCVVTDALLLTTCSIADLAGLTVTVGSLTAVTTAGGRFEIVIPSGVQLANERVTVTGSTVTTSVTTITTTVPQSIVIPVMSTSAFNNLVLATGISLTAGSGSVMSVVLQRGVPVSGVTVISTPSPAFGPFFDGSQPPPWTLNATGTRGIVFFPGITTGTATITFTDPSTAGETTVDGIQVVDGGITFVDAILP
jgi:hypothetical protein